MSSSSSSTKMDSFDEPGFGANFRSAIEPILKPIASIKLTITMFTLGMVVVFVGSLAQARRDVWLVVDQYFRTFVAWIDVADLFPPAMFPGFVETNWDQLGSFRYLPFPGGWAIGWILFANLIAAHYLKFKIRADGGRLTAGVSIMAVGGLLTWLVITTGNGQTGVETANTVLSPMQIWYLMLGVLAISAAIPLASAFLNSRQSTYSRILMGIAGIVLGIVFLYFLIGGEQARLNLSSMRILWQLLKGTACAMVMLIGSNLLFAKRGGIVVLHIGVGMLMLSELQVGFYADEHMMRIAEGETVNYMQDVRSRELAVTYTDDQQQIQVTAIPESRIVQAALSGSDDDKVISLDNLPFDIRIDQFMRNSVLTSRLPGENSDIQSGLGSFAKAKEIQPAMKSDEQDLSAVKVTLLNRKSGKAIQTILCAQEMSDMRDPSFAEVARVDGTDYQLYLRFRRTYKNYEVKLLDASRRNYVGTSTPRDYRSRIVMSHPKAAGADSNDDEREVQEEEFTIWMNNPLRYEGETFYQSSYMEASDGTAITTLSVVRNTGWMLPYISCMILAVGMLAQFGQTLGRYLSRLERQHGARKPETAETEIIPTDSEEPGLADEAQNVLPEDDLLTQQAIKRPTGKKSGSSKASLIFTTVLLVLSIGWLGSKLRTPKPKPNMMHVQDFAKLPVAWRGRPQPIDSLARSELLMISHKSTFEGELAPYEVNDEVRKNLEKRINAAWPELKWDAKSLEKFSGEYTDWINKLAEITRSDKTEVEQKTRDLLTRRMSATRWLLDLFAQPKRAARHRVVRIDDDVILALLGLSKRPGLSYSTTEIEENWSGVNQLLIAAQQKQTKGQDHKLSVTERRIISLDQTIRRLSGLQSSMDELDQSSIVMLTANLWNYYQFMESPPGIMIIPTDLEPGNDSQTKRRRSWEPLPIAQMILKLNQLLKERGITDRAGWNGFVMNGLSEDLAYQSLTEILSALKRAAQEKQVKVTEAAKTVAEQTEEGSTEAIIYSKIAEGPEDITADALMKSLSAEQRMAVQVAEEEKFQGILVKRLSGPQATPEHRKKVNEIFDQITEQDKQLRKTLDEQGADFAEFGEKFAEHRREQAQVLKFQLMNIVMDDLEATSGDIIFSGEESQTFEVSTESITQLVDAWEKDDIKTFNATVDKYSQWLDQHDVETLVPGDIRLETFFNRFEPIMKAMYLYLPVALLAFLSWIGWSQPLRKAGFWLMALAFVLHTIALGMRMEISGRPPVTNLYSSAIFIGWAVVLACFIVEPLLKNGIGNIIGASVGMASLMVAHYLAIDEGDTIGVMQAVLDTTFWLATHVVCITLGYAATFLAGAFGIAYCIHSKLGAETQSEQTVQLGKITYGTLCFALFLSLIGTILGGLWADDSWGRFWGWDPKENGAMLIVMWNAIVLHARWDKMIRDYGTAVLAIVGNIVTAWSWFGVNELQAGLHTYGFTEGRLQTLLLFAIANVVMIVIAVIPAALRKAK